MKICTACNTTYTDDSLNFCLVDGTTLTPQENLSSNTPFSYDPSSWNEAETPTQVSNRANFTRQNPEPPPTVALFSPPSSYIPQNLSSAPPAGANRGFVYAAIIAGAVIFGVIVVVGAIIAVNWNSPSGANNSTVRNSAANTTVNNAVTVGNAKLSANSSPTSNSNTVETKPTFNMIGTWSGKFDKAAASLNITNQSGETFSGTLLTKGYTVEIAGQTNSARRTVSIRETKVLKTPAGSIWNLGKDDGTISENGKSMSGTGRDKNISYSWSFTKQ